MASGKLSSSHSVGCSLMFLPGVTEINVGVVRAIMTLHMIACFAFSFMLLSAVILPEVKRHTVWYSFCLSWIFFTLSYSLLSFGGQQFNGRADGLCAAQAVMVHTAPFL